MLPKFNHSGNAANPAYSFLLPAWIETVEAHVHPGRQNPFCPWFIKFIILMFASIGEAANLGPLTIGTSNPTGALGKAHLFQELPGADHSRIWGLSETHLTTPGIEKFKFELKMQRSPWKIACVAPEPPLSQAQGTIGGKASATSGQLMAQWGLAIR